MKVDGVEVEPHYGSWYPINVQYESFQYAAWRNAAAGFVLVVEDYIGMHSANVDDTITVVLLPEDWTTNTAILHHIAKDCEAVGEGIRAAIEYMENNPDG